MEVGPVVDEDDLEAEEEAVDEEDEREVRLLALFRLFPIKAAVTFVNIRGLTLLVGFLRAEPLTEPRMLAIYNI